MWGKFDFGVYYTIAITSEYEITYRLMDAIGIEPISSTRTEILPLNYTSYLLIRLHKRDLNTLIV